MERKRARKDGLGEEEAYRRVRIRELVAKLEWYREEYENTLELHNIVLEEQEDDQKALALLREENAKLRAENAKLHSKLEGR